MKEGWHADEEGSGLELSASSDNVMPAAAPALLSSGLIIEFACPHSGGRRTATFLPEVAAHEGWDKQQVPAPCCCAALA